MTRIRYRLIVIAAVATLVACGDKPSQPQVTGSPPPSSAPATTPAPTPTPPPTTSAPNPAETAKDSAATNPKEAMSKEQESKGMPMAGQANNHSSTALDAKETKKQ